MGPRTYNVNIQSNYYDVEYTSLYAAHKSGCNERDTESRYHSVVSYITYLLKRPFFPVLGLVPI